MENIIFTGNSVVELKEFLGSYTPDNVFVLTDTNTSRHCLPHFEQMGFRPENVIVVGEGEMCKSLESVSLIWSVLMERGARRSSVLVNIGGGMITDIGGFAASCFKRGIKCVNIPTTLLSQVDASVGGKTGINFGGLKNEIGTFSMPELVIIDACFLKTLPYRQLLSGFAEMLKHALLAGGEHFSKILDTDLKRIDWKVFPGLVEESVNVKYSVVRKDPKENGIRKALNFGHTVGHAIESAAIEHRQELYHGDAVAYGMIAELWLSVRRLGLEESVYEKIRDFIRTIYPPYVPVVDNERLYQWMLHDKKNERSGVNFTLLHAPGEFSIDNYCEREEIMDALAHLL